MQLVLDHYRVILVKVQYVPCLCYTKSLISDMSARGKYQILLYNDAEKIKRVPRFVYFMVFCPISLSIILLNNFTTEKKRIIRRGKRNRHYSFLKL